MNEPKRLIKEIELLDAMCGTGKSYNLFKFIAASPHELFLYVTPMLSEVASRAAVELAKFEGCDTVFHEPTGEKFASKGEHLLVLLSGRKNVICTHALFQGLGKAGQKAIAGTYTIIIDEEMGMIEPLANDVLRLADRKLLFDEKVITLDDDGRVVWHAEAWGGDDSVFSSARTMADGGSLYCNRDGTFFNVQVPVEIISAAKRVIVATYLFKGSIFKAFLKVKGIGDKPFTFDGLALRDERALKKALQERIELFPCAITTDKLLEELGVPLGDLRAKRGNRTFSSSYYANVRPAEIAKIGNHIRNVARQMDVSPDELIYTLPSKIAGKCGKKWTAGGPKIIKVKGYSPKNCYLHKGARATNDYAHKTAAIHCYNRYPHPAVTRYLEDHGAKVDADSFALAELIQWFFRTAIRVPDGPKVKLHITSPRMEHLFIQWLYDVA